MTIMLALLACLASGIEWSHSYDEAIARAKEQSKVVFIAINMDGERANDTIAAKVYSDKAIVDLTHATVNLIASNDEHKGGTKSCPRFAGIPCSAHVAVDVEIRGTVVKSTAAGWVIAPQHVFLRPTGEVILSVPYTVDASELTWCFLEAQRAVDPSFKTRGGRAPKRLVVGSVFDPGGGDESGVMSRERALELLEEAKRTSHDEMSNLFYRLITADEPEARAFAKTQFGAKWMTYYGNDTLAKSVRAVGETSPASYWEVILQQTKDGDPKIRREVAVAMEQLAAPESLKDVTGAYKKEKEVSVQKEWIRALGTVGPSSSAARKELMKVAQSEKAKNLLLRKNAILALGSLDLDEALAAALEGWLGDENPEVRRAAACAMAISRDPRFLGSLQARTGDVEARTTIDVAIAALKGEGKLKDLGTEVAAVGEDEVPRQRIFGW